MAESTLSVIYADLVRELERYLRIATGSETTWIDDLLRTGLRRFYTAYDWKFLRITATLTTQAPYETGTVAIAAGVVTLTGGTFPAWAASGVLVLDNVTYEVSTRDSGTQVTLEDTSVTVAAGESYVLAQYAYTLPDDFGQLLPPMTYHPGLNEAYRQIELADERDVRVGRMYQDEVDPPCVVAVRPKTFTATTGQRFEAVFFPLPDATYQLTYRYRAHPDKVATTHYPRGGMLHAETVRLAVLAAAELSRLDTPGAYEALYQEQLKVSIQRENEMHAPDRLGRMYDPGEREGDTSGYPSRIDRGSPYPPYTD